MSNTVIETDETMVILPEQEVWVNDIHGKGVDTDALGGIDGEANTGLRGLVNRTALLKKTIDALLSWKEGIDFSSFSLNGHTHTLYVLPDTVYRTDKRQGVLAHGEDLVHVNLNDFTETGIFYQRSNVNADNGINFPAPLAGILTVKGTNSFVYQTYRTYGSNNETYTRNFYGTEWGLWKKIRTEDDLVIGNWQNLTLQGSFTGHFKIRETVLSPKVRFVEIDAFLQHPSTSNGAEKHIVTIPLAFHPACDQSLVFHKIGGLFPYAFNGFLMVDNNGNIAESDKGYVGIKFSGGSGNTYYGLGTSYFIIGGTA